MENRKNKFKLTFDKSFNSIINYLNEYEVILILFDINKQFQSKIKNTFHIDKNVLKEVRKYYKIV